MFCRNGSDDGSEKDASPKRSLVSSLKDDPKQLSIRGKGLDTQ